ncbi:Programmed cell death protein 2 [Bienertia sinuspersici]
MQILFNFKVSRFVIQYFSVVNASRYNASRINTPPAEEAERMVDNMHDFDEGDDEEQEQVPVKLGFVGKTSIWLVGSPSSVPLQGGTYPVNLPTGKSCLCDLCGEPLQFLLQVYAPISEKDSTFHRTLYVFMCLKWNVFLETNMSNGNVDHKSNPEEDLKARKNHDIFCTCEGLSLPTLASVVCLGVAHGRDIKYVGAVKQLVTALRKHQEMHWRDHKLHCQQFSLSFKSSDGSCNDNTSSKEMLVGAYIFFYAEALLHGSFASSSTQTFPVKKRSNHGRKTRLLQSGRSAMGLRPIFSRNRVIALRVGTHTKLVATMFRNGRTPFSASKTLWPEYEIVCEDESEFSNSDADEHSDSLVSMQQMEETFNSLMDSFEGDDDRQNWATFQQHLAKAPEQILRYSRDELAKPLWPTSSGRPSRADIPNCSSCAGAMKFEFQILPQLLYYFHVKNDDNSLDWATIVVYTCANSCEGSPPYKEEFAWVQLTVQVGHLCSVILNHNPDNVKVLFRRACAAMGLGKYELACWDLKLAYDLELSNHEVVKKLKPVRESKEEEESAKHEESEQCNNHNIGNCTMTDVENRDGRNQAIDLDHNGKPKSMEVEMSESERV